MTINSPTHRRIPWDIGRRLMRRRHGGAQPHAGGRGSDAPPAPASAARLWIDGGGG